MPVSDVPGYELFELERNERLVIDLNEGLSLPGFFQVNGLQEGWGADLPFAAVLAGRQIFQLTDVRFTDWNVDTLITSGHVDYDKPFGLKGVAYEEGVLIGRNQLRTRFNYDLSVMRDHFLVVQGIGSVAIKNKADSSAETVVLTGHRTERGLF